MFLSRSALSGFFLLWYIGSSLQVFWFREGSRADVSSFSTSSRLVQQLKHRTHNLALFIRRDHTNGDSAPFLGNDRGVHAVGSLIQHDAKTSQPLTDARSDHRRILTNTSTEDQRVQSAQRSSE